MSKAILMTDLTATEDDELCGRRYWYAHLEGGRGILPRTQVIASRILDETLRDLRTVAQMDEKDLSADNLEVAINDILKELTPAEKSDRPNLELLYRRLGWLTAFALYQEPYLRRTYEPLLLPEEVLFTHDNLFVRMQTGRALKYRNCREIIYRSYIPTHFISARWRERFYRMAAPQVEMKAVEKALGQKVDAMQVMGLAQGYYARPGNLGLAHPYVLAYYHDGRKEWTHNYMTGKGEGWRERNVWEYEDGLVPWVLRCGRDVADQQFPLTGRILPRQDILDAWLAHRVHREQAILGAAGDSHVNLSLRNVYFPQNTQSCTPMLGDSCPYEGLCWGAEGVKNNPLLPGSGYVRNTLKPHLLPPSQEVETVVGEVVA